jgi:peroxiredoxin
MPALESYSQAHKSEGLVVVGADFVDDAQTIASFANTYGVTYPLFRDPGQRAYTTYQVNKTPSSFIIDRQGVIRQVAAGPLNAATLDQTVLPLLKS